MTSNILINLFTLDGFMQLMKWLILFLELSYLVVAFIMVFEVKLMNKSFKTGFAPLFTLIALGNLGATIIAILISLTLL